ncbi:MAG TPA: diguanylate cyclase, partial [Candidatus Baltobacteraceae bacterium]|nr:diguanylate cyclase [Candidatus Baltobacteraceae bacterium]
MRSVAELFASDVALDVLRERFCSLIASAFRADRVTFALRTPEGDRVVNLMEGGVPREIAEAAPAAGSPLSLVLSSERIVDAGNVLGAPLIFRTHVMGAILAERSERYDADDAALLESCGLFVAARMHDEDARRRGDRFEELAFSDALTNIANRRKFDETFVAEWKRSLRAHLSLTVVMIDIDYFKAFNDTYGHQAGDRCLQQVAQAMNSCIARPGDLLARYGGEEFVALLPATPLDGGVAIAEAFQSAVAKAAIVHEGSSLGTVSLSIGVASTEPTDDVEPESLVREADVALYRAKEAGRNRVAAQSYLSNAEQAVRTGGISRTNLPSEMSRLIGRATECDEVRELLRSHRLVSIVGVGGSGKTRVSVQAAAGMINEFKNGVWFVDLSAIHQPELVATAIGVALSVPIASDANGPDELVNLLRRKSLLLVLDNCEHLLDSVTPLVERLMTECAGVYVLATSREPLAAPTE